MSARGWRRSTKLFPAGTLLICSLCDKYFHAEEGVYLKKSDTDFSACEVCHAYVEQKQVERAMRKGGLHGGSA